VDEAVLLMQARDGDQRAFAELVTAHRTRMWAVCLQICGDQHDAEDALQATLVAAWRYLDRFRGEARLSTRLHRIAANNAIEVVRKRRSDTQLTDFTDPEQPVQLEDSPHRIGFDEQIALSDAVRAALSALSDDLREAIVLREFGDLTYNDIAEHQGVGVQTVKSRLNRARTQLAAALRDQLGE
jgi:RNA polymerase sigma factor (sigma-70 family)